MSEQSLSKHYIDANSLLQDAFRLGLMILKSGFRPDFIVGVWRGGTPVGIAVQEVLQVHGVPADHIAIRTSSYTGIAQRDRQVRVHGLDYLTERVRPHSRVLIVDDVFDTGLSVEAVLERLRQRAGAHAPIDIRLAMPWYKPANNRTSLQPDYHVHQTGHWLVFPHELDGLSGEEIRQQKPGLYALYEEFGLAEG